MLRFLRKLVELSRYFRVVARVITRHEHRSTGFSIYGCGAMAGAVQVVRSLEMAADRD